MMQKTIAAEQSVLRSWIDAVYGFSKLELVSKEDFLRGLWGAIANLVHHNKQNPLVQEAVRRYPDLIPRGFTILSILYGAYTCAPSKAAVLKDLVDMLPKDMTEVELEVCSYAKTKNDRSFFPELSSIFGKIREIYGAEHFRLEVLPPTPYHAYALYVLNHSELLEKNIRIEEMFGHLSVSNSQVEKVLTFAKPSDPLDPPESSKGHVLH